MTQGSAHDALDPVVRNHLELMAREIEEQTWNRLVGDLGVERTEGAPGRG
jgi:hypothetical protein